MIEIFKEFTFDAAHYLPNVPDTHPCKRMHGHTYRVRVTLSGEPHPELGWVRDFGEIKAAFQPILHRMDHHVLNEIEGLENSTAENVAIWIWNQLKDQLPELSEVLVRETPSSGCIYRG